MNVYVAGGYIPNGGTYMAYHLGRILHKIFGYNCIIIKINNEDVDNGIFSYPYHFDCVTVKDMEKNIKEEDILIANPSFSYLSFGTRLPGRKLMYIQGFNTYSVIDGFFNYYVSVSTFVRQFVHSVYKLDTEVIPAFIHTNYTPPAWEGRPEIFLVVGKIYLQELVKKFVDTLRTRHPEIRPRLRIQNRKISHAKFLHLMMHHRYLLTLSPCEGFGLQPLEGMANGCTVVGFDGCGGQDFMRTGKNCEVVRYPDVDTLVDKVAYLVEHPAYAYRLAKQGAIDAKKYDIDTFESRWTKYFKEVMKLKCVHPSI